MALNYTQQAMLSQDPMFQARVAIALIERAHLVKNEAANLNPNQTQRYFLAQQIIDSPDSYIRKFVLGVASRSNKDATSVNGQVVQTAVTDTEIKNDLSNIFDSSVPK